jgi:outer membrane protein OmpA-like peptidoglycan-associated protein
VVLTLTSTLTTRGIDASRLDTIGKGESDPVADNTKNGKDNPEGQAMNRRVELKVK